MTPVARRTSARLEPVLTPAPPARAGGDRRRPRARAGAHRPRRLRPDRPPALLGLPLGALNLHPSLLPRHRGASPIPATILEGDAEAGVTLMRMDAGLDTGPIVAVRARPAGRRRRRRPSSRRRLAAVAAGLLGRSLGPWIRGELRARPRSPRTARRSRDRCAARTGASTRRVRPRSSSDASAPTCRGPGTFLEVDGERLVVTAASLAPSQPGRRARSPRARGGPPGARDGRRAPGARRGHARRAAAPCRVPTGSAAAARP